jgi:hypothetical protein
VAESVKRLYKVGTLELEHIRLLAREEIVTTEQNYVLG